MTLGISVYGWNFVMLNKALHKGHRVWKLVHKIEFSGLLRAPTWPCFKSRDFDGDLVGLRCWTGDKKHSRWPFKSESQLFKEKAFTYFSFTLRCRYGRSTLAQKLNTVCIDRIHLISLFQIKKQLQLMNEQRQDSRDGTRFRATRSHEIKLPWDFSSMP